METTHITDDIKFRGEISYEGNLEIEGSVEGKIRSDGALTIEQGGVVKGNVDTRQISIKGDVQGNMKAELINISTSGKVQGDIECKQLQIDRGGIHNGVTSMS
ncbi:MAG: polymer-forming cytoskeletal protein [Leptospirales bacterium]